MSESLDAVISPHGWPIDIRATIDPESRAAWHHDGENLYCFGPDDYEVVSLWAGEPEPVDERPPCTCDGVTLLNRGCVCPHMDGRRYVVAR